MTDKKKLERLVRRMKKAKDNIAKERDELRECIDEYDSIIDSAGDAKESLEYAIERLSEYL